MYAISLAAAAKEIWVANSYFLPDDTTAGLFVAAVKRGVDVRVIVPSDEHNDVPATKAAGPGGRSSTAGWAIAASPRCAWSKPSFAALRKRRS